MSSLQTDQNAQLPVILPRLFQKHHSLCRIEIVKGRQRSFRETSVSTGGSGRLLRRHCDVSAAVEQGSRLPQSLEKSRFFATLRMTSGCPLQRFRQAPRRPVEVTVPYAPTNLSERCTIRPASCSRRRRAPPASSLSCPALRDRCCGTLWAHLRSGGRSCRTLQWSL